MTELQRVISSQGRLQKWVANELNITPQRLQGWTSGRNQVPDEYKVKLSKLLKVSVQKLFFNEER